MTFPSLHFLAFFAIVLSLALALSRRASARNALLLAASYYFYGCWDWRFLGLLALSTVVDYCCGLGLDPDRPGPADPARRRRRRRALLLISLVTNLGILGFFKYYGFFVESLAAVLEQAGLEAPRSTLKVILPVGVSFYTFQTLSYTIDLYLGRMKPERNLMNFALFVAFFPQLVAGPIERASRMLPQLRSPARVGFEDLRVGLFGIGLGLFQKVVVADNVAKVVDPVFASSSPPAWAVLCATYGFAIQIYCDFLGYSNVAIGAARCLGIRLMRNFEQPYLSGNPREFWRCWHISLSTWLRDYLYVPLGGNRKGPRRTQINLMLTMLLGGLWHGAAWTFVLWGFLHGSLLMLHRQWERLAARWPGAFAFREARLGRLLLVLCFFHGVCLAWIPFRASSMAELRAMLAGLGNWAVPDGAALAQSLWILLPCALWTLGTDLLARRSGSPYSVLEQPILVRGLSYFAAAFLFVVCGEYEGSPFLYFQF